MNILWFCCLFEAIKEHFDWILLLLALRQGGRYGFVYIIVYFFAHLPLVYRTPRLRKAYHFYVYVQPPTYTLPYSRLEG